jgi:hypothetical protein
MSADSPKAKPYPVWVSIVLPSGSVMFTPWDSDDGLQEPTAVYGG